MASCQQNYYGIAWLLVCGIFDGENTLYNAKCHIIRTCFDLFDFSFMLAFRLGVRDGLLRFEKLNDETRFKIDFDFCVAGRLAAEEARLSGCLSFPIG